MKRDWGNKYGANPLLDGEAEGLTRKCIDAALGGDVAALRICIDPILPPRKERPVNFKLPPLKSAEELWQRWRPLPKRLLRANWP